MLHQQVLCQGTTSVVPQSVNKIGGALASERLGIPPGAPSLDFET
jgi:hypothetical protein